ncbi:hypothetical protein HYX13_00940 [Candidatus Woesearchaeota archaeon]|nr:hypothetical protein [Candidatus Woesearchaeota archaeon]
MIQKKERMVRENLQLFSHFSRRKRGEVQLMETISILFIFFILVSLGILFYAKYKSVAFQHQQDAFQEARARELTLRIVYLPELQCSKSQAEAEEHCVDMLKVNGLEDWKNTLEEKFTDYYFDIFSYAKVTLYQIYPEEQEWEIYTPPKLGFKSARTNRFIVALRDDTLGETTPAYGYGYLEVVAYS